MGKFLRKAFYYVIFTGKKTSFRRSSSTENSRLLTNTVLGSFVLQKEKSNKLQNFKKDMCVYMTLKVQLIITFKKGCKSQLKQEKRRKLQLNGSGLLICCYLSESVWMVALPKEISTFLFLVAVTNTSEFTQQDGRKKRTAKCFCVTNVTGL